MYTPNIRMLHMQILHITYLMTSEPPCLRAPVIERLPLLTAEAGKRPFSGCNLLLITLLELSAATLSYCSVGSGFCMCHTTFRPQEPTRTTASLVTVNPSSTSPPLPETDWALCAIQGPPHPKLFRGSGLGHLGSVLSLEPPWLYHIVRARRLEIVNSKPRRAEMDTMASCLDWIRRCPAHFESCRPTMLNPLFHHE